MSYRKYVKDYKPRLVPDKDGRGMKEIYVYKGPRFTVSLRPPLQKEQVRMRLLLYAAAAAAMLVLAGLQIRLPSPVRSTAGPSTGSR